MQITLNETEQRLATFIGKIRARARDGKVDHCPQFFSNSLDRHIQGAAAEVAFCRHRNIFPDTEQHQGPGSVYPQWDCVDPALGRVDVKTSSGSSHNLIAPLYKSMIIKGDDHPDTYVLVTGVMPVYEIVGYCRYEELICESSIRDLGQGDTYFVHRHDLKPIPNALAPTQG